MPNVTLKQLASSHAADTASAILRAGLDAPAVDVVSTVTVEDADLCVEVIVRRRRRAEPTANTLPTLREIEQAIYDKSPLPDKVPVTVKKLATMTGYRLNTYFRDAVRRLIDLGLLTRVTGGVRRA